MMALFGKVGELLGSGLLASYSLDPLPVHSLLPNTDATDHLPQASAALPHLQARQYPFINCKLK